MLVTDRSYRRELTSHGVISFDKKVLNVTLKNLSMTGMLAELLNDQDTLALKNIFYSVEGSRIIDVQLPEMNLSGTAEIIRFDDGKSTYIALEFKELTYKRKSVRSHVKQDNALFNGTTVAPFPDKNEIHVA